jgi:hypothetical protein
VEGEGAIAARGQLLLRSKLVSLSVERPTKVASTSVGNRS